MHDKGALRLEASENEGIAAFFRIVSAFEGGGDALDGRPRQRERVASCVEGTESVF